MENADSTLPPPAACSRPARSRFQFGLRTLLIATTGLAILLSGLFAGPSWMSFLTLVIVVLAVPMCLTVGLIYGQGYHRTFCIGALFPSGSILGGMSLFVFPGGFYALVSGNISDFGSVPQSDETLAKLVTASGVLIGIVVVIAFGFAACGLRWLIQQSARPVDSGSPFDSRQQ